MPETFVVCDRRYITFSEMFFFFAFCKGMLLKIHCFLYSFCEVSVLLHKKFIAKSRAVFIRYSKMFSSKEHVWLKLL